MVDQDLGFASLKSITAYRRMRSSEFLDQDATATLNVNIWPQNFDNAFTQEFQLTSVKSGDFRWVAGAFYMNDSAGYTGRGFQIVSTVPVSSLITDQTNHSISGYGEGTLDIARRIHVTAGLRYTHDQRQLNAERYNLPSGTSFAGYPIDKEASFSKLTYRGIVSVDLTSSIMAYVSYSRGFKGGLFNSTNPPGDAVRPTTVDATEGGFKADLFSRHLRLNGSIYDYRFKDIQINQIIAGANVLQNAARATIRGAELETDILPFRNFRLNGSVAYIFSRFDSFPNAPFYTLNPAGGETLATGDAGGLRLPQTPKFTGRILAEYMFDTAVGRWTLQGTAYRNSGFFYSPDNRLAQNPYTLVGSAIKWMSSDERYELSLWVQNLTKAKYLSYATQVAPYGDHGGPAPPRTFGVTGRFHL